ncbi:signal peptidase II [Acetivibrio clariflavus]|uniref:signal peptidase II n=1 Tax=Acetivibrio clariflavus TaxID=288965 RepID=UPI000489CE57|nr:signal peptidase II [Acetivibrio clariflavus]
MFIVILLVAIDLIIKYIIYMNFMKTKIKLFNGFFGFLPLINRSQMSIFNKELGMGLSNSFLLIINLLILIILIFLYYRFYKLKFLNLHTKLILIMFISAAICSIIDKIVLGGSLDYILLNKTVFDLKDIYLSIAYVYGIIYAIKNSSKSSSIKDDVIILKKY